MLWMCYLNFCFPQHLIQLYSNELVLFKPLSWFDMIPTKSHFLDILFILALTVRFLTRRFITEYAEGRDSAYVRSFVIQGRSIEVKIIDQGDKVAIFP